jgi:hypothetical protein
VTGHAASADPRYPHSTDEARAGTEQRQASEPAPATPCVSARTPTSTDEARATAAARLDASPEVAEPTAAPARRGPTSTDGARALVERQTSTQHVKAAAPSELPICMR